MKLVRKFEAEKWCSVLPFYKNIWCHLTVVDAIIKDPDLRQAFSSHCQPMGQASWPRPPTDADIHAGNNESVKVNIEVSVRRLLQQSDVSKWLITSTLQPLIASADDRRANEDGVYAAGTARQKMEHMLNLQEQNQLYTITDVWCVNQKAAANCAAVSRASTERSLNNAGFSINI